MSSVLPVDGSCHYYVFTGRTELPGSVLPVDGSDHYCVFTGRTELAGSVLPVGHYGRCSSCKSQ